MFCIFAVFILAQGFSWKVAMTGVLDEHGSDTCFAFSHKDSLEKWRWQRSWTIVAQMHFLHYRTRILLKSREGSSPESMMYFHCFYKNCHYLLRILTHFQRRVMFASSWPSSLPQEFWFSYKDFHQQLKRRPRWIMLASKRPPWSKVEWTAKMNHVSIKVAVSPLFCCQDVAHSSPSPKPLLHSHAGLSVSVSVDSMFFGDGAV